MEIRKYESGLISSNMYLVIEESNAIVIDPCELIDPAESLTIDQIILTHEHYDHISGVNKWKKITRAPVLCSRICGESIENPKKNLARYFEDFCSLQTWLELDMIPESDSSYNCRADQFFDDRFEFEWMGHWWKLFEMPGHSPGSIGILLDNNYFFSGDSLMRDYEIELRFPWSSKRKWNEVGKPRLDSIPDGIRVYPGHFEDFILNRKEG